MHYLTQLRYLQGIFPHWESAPQNSEATVNPQIARSSENKLVETGTTPPETPVTQRKVETDQSSTIKFQIVNNTEAERFYWSDLQHYFCSIISTDDFFKLTGKRDGKEIIAINGREYAVVPHGHLKSGQIIPNVSCPELNTVPLEASSSKKKVHKHRRAIVTISVPSERRDEKIVLSPLNLKNAITKAIGDLPIADGRTYRMNHIDYDGGYFWADISFQVDIPDKNDPTKKSAGDQRTEDEKDQKHQPAVNLLSDSNDIAFHFQCDAPGLSIRDEKHWTKGHSMRCLICHGSDLDNKVTGNMGLFRSMSPNYQEDHKVSVLVRMGDFHYFMDPGYCGEDVDSTLMVNSVFPQPAGKYVRIETTPIQETLATATECRISLVWHRYRAKDHGLSEQQIEELVRKTLKEVPLEKGKRFLVNITGKNGVQCVLAGTVESVAGPDSGIENVFSYGSETRLDLQAGDNSILHGGRPSPRPLQEAVQQLSKGLSGVDTIAEQIARRVVLPYGSEEAERGILLYGAAGTGKTIMAHNIAHSMGALPDNIKIIDSASILKGSPAESVEALNKIIEEVDHQKKYRDEVCVLVIDEIDTILCSKGFGGPSEKQSAINTALLNILDGLEPHPNLIVVGTTNVKLSKFDDALLRTKRLAVQINMGLPDHTQRLAIVTDAFGKLSDPEVRLSTAQVNYLADASHGCDCARLVQIVAEIRAEVRRTFTSDSNVTTVIDSAMRKVLLDTSAIREDREKALKVCSQATPSILTSSEREALKKTQAVLQRTTQKIGQKSIILINAEPGARSRLFCHEVLKQSQGFSHYRAITEEGRMIDTAEEAIREAKDKLASVFAIDRADQLVAQGSPMSQPESVGMAWKSNIQDRHCSAALLLVAEPIAGQNQDVVVQQMGLPKPRTVISLKAGISHEEMKQTLEEHYPDATDSDRQAVLSVFDNGHVTASRFNDLVEYWQNDDGSWDIENLKDEYLSDRDDTDGMYS